MVNLPQKVYSYIILGALVKKLLLQDSAGCHFGFGPLAKNADIFAKDMGLHFL